MSAPVEVVTVVLTREQFQRDIAAAVAHALEAQQPPSDWTDQEGIAAHLGVSSPTIKKMAEQDGLPHVFAGAHRRFSRRTVDAWLVERAAQKAGR